MTAVSGTVEWGIVPTNNTSSQLAEMSWSARGNKLKSANDSLRYQVQWLYGGITEAEEVTLEGGVINVIFKVETSVDDTNFTTIGTIKKSRDVVNKKYDNESAPIGHRFTIDVSRLVSDQLSYSLCPMNKGTWQSPFYGGMNGGLTMQDNVISGTGGVGNPVSDYNVSQNGTFRRLRVSATFDILDSNLDIVTSTTTLNSYATISVINSVNQFERDDVYYYGQFLINQNGVTSNLPKRFLTRCPNWYYDDTENKVAYHKSVRMDDDAEFLQWYVDVLQDDVSTEPYEYSEIYGVAYKEDGSTTEFILADFNSLLADKNPTQFETIQRRMLIQNVSPAFINDNAYTPQLGALRPYNVSVSPITSNVYKYSLNFRGRYYVTTTTTWVTITQSATNWYEIDRETKNTAYEYVRFHWLNSMGGIDSYTAKRSVVEGLTISRDVVERKSRDRTWYQANSGAVNSAEINVADTSYISDTMRGGDLYKGGREVSNVNADRVQSVYTDPLNKSVAKWLEEMMLSPNVWIEKDTEATAKGNSSNPYLRPSTKGYIPVIITNSDIETVNQENGLVRFNIEYTLAHKVQTQRN